MPSMCIYGYSNCCTVNVVAEHVALDAFSKHVHLTTVPLVQCMWIWMPQGLTDAFPATLPTTPGKKVIVKNLIEFIHPLVKYHQIIANAQN